MYGTKQKNKVRIHPESMKVMVDSAWEFAHAALWEEISFSKFEIRESKRYIRRFFRKTPSDTTLAERFCEFCERVILARDYVRRSPCRYIPHPCIWLDPINEKGFAGTKAWYKDRKRKRLQKRCSQSQIIILYHPVNY